METRRLGFEFGDPSAPTGIAFENEADARKVIVLAFLKMRGDSPRIMHCPEAW